MISAEQTVSAGGCRRNGAVPAGKRVTVTLTLERSIGVRKAFVRLWPDGGSGQVIPLVWKSLMNEREVWSAVLPPLPAGLFFYDFELLLSEREVSVGGDRSLTEGGVCRLLVHIPPRRAADKLWGKMIYHVFVDRFFRSGRCEVRPGGVFNPDWKNGVPQYATQRGGYVKNNEFFGGDLWGVCDKLGYISSLGADYIYLSPIFDSPSNHKYDTGDYMSVDRYFGGDEALRTLISEAGKLGIGIILDGVFNHTGDDSVYFNKYGHYGALGAYQSEKSPYHRWYDFRRFPDDYACWWNIPILPRVDSADESYRRFICGRVLEKWSRLKIAGWRLDVPDELSDPFLDDFRRSLEELDSDAFVIGEVWEDASDKISYGRRRRYLSSSQMDSVMNYPFRDAVIGYLLSGDADMFRRTVEGIIWRYPSHVTYSLMNFLGTHDTPRILTVLGGGSESDSNDEMAHDRLSPTAREQALRLTGVAFMLISLLPGALSVYYGDEAGMEGHGDPFCRRPFPWGEECPELLALVKRLGAIRRRHPAFCDGEFAVISIDTDTAILSRQTKGDHILCAVNRARDSRRLRTRRDMRELFTGAEGREFTLAPQSAVYLHSTESHAGAEWII